jgi:hypothetical protein
MFKNRGVQMRKKIAYAFTAFLIAAVISPMGLMMHFSPAMAHSGITLSAWTWNPPTIDGTIGDDEWRTAAKADFNITTPDGIYNATIYVMNDYENLYLAAKITDDDLGTDISTYDLFRFNFDNDHDGASEKGDDGLFCWSIPGLLYDVFNNETTGWPGDNQDGGTKDGFHAVSGDGIYNYFECFHPLDSADDAHDFSLKIGDTVGFCIFYYDNATYIGSWPSFPHPSNWHDIKIASPNIYQGDLVLSDNDIYTITGKFDINGSIIITENATLILKDALLNFTQTANFQFNITLRSATNGNPHLIADNATITTGGYFIKTSLYENSTAQINQLEATYASLWLELNDISSAEVANSNFLGIILYDSSTLNLTHSTLGAMHIYTTADVNIDNSSFSDIIVISNLNMKVQNSSITRLKIYSSTTQTLINELKPAMVTYWNYLENCSVIIDSGYAPNITLNDTQVDNWSFTFTNSQHIIVYLSELNELRLQGSSMASVYETHIKTVELYGSSRLNATDSKAHEALLSGSSTIWSVNSTAETDAQISDQAAIYVNWYLNVYVQDSLGQYVPDANVTVTCADGTKTASGKTNMYGWVRLTVLSFILNASNVYYQGPHNLTAVHGTHENSTTIDVNENTQATVILSDFIIPEFPSLLSIVTVLAAATSLITAKFFKSKNTIERR